MYKFLIAGVIALFSVTAHADLLLSPDDDAVVFENQMTIDEKQLIQTALIWTGDYIFWADGKFGKGTRTAISNWQSKNGFQDTGYLTKEQIVLLIQNKKKVENELKWVTLPNTNISPQYILKYPNKLLIKTDTNKFSNEYSGIYLLAGCNTNADYVYFDNSYFETKEKASDILIDYKRDNVFIVKTTFYNKVHTKFFRYSREEIRGNISCYYNLFWPESIKEVMFPVEVAMSNSFWPFGYDDNHQEPTYPNINQLLLTTSIQPEPNIVQVPKEEPKFEPRPKIATDTIAAYGTGWVVNTNGYVITNNHVIDECTYVKVENDRAQIVAHDSNMDLALLHVDRQYDSQLTLRESSNPELGEDVVAFGFPYTQLLGSLNVTPGVVSSITGIRGSTSNFQINAAVQPGNSGGPLLDVYGQVIGVVVARLNDKKILEETGSLPQNINFAIRVELLKAFLLQNDITPVLGNSEVELRTKDIVNLVENSVKKIYCYN